MTFSRILSSKETLLCSCPLYQSQYMCYNTSKLVCYSEGLHKGSARIWYSFFNKMSEVGIAAKFHPFILAGWKGMHATPEIQTLNKVWEQILIASNYLQVMSQVNNEKFKKNPISSSNGNIFILQILNDILIVFQSFCSWIKQL